MPWREHIHVIIQAIAELSNQPAEVLVASGFSAITTTQRAVAALVATFFAGVAAAATILAFFSGVLEAPQHIEELREYTMETRMQVREVDSDTRELIQRMDTLICELREERTGTRPAGCPSGILRP